MGRFFKSHGEVLFGGCELKSLSVTQVAAVGGRYVAKTECPGPADGRSSTGDHHETLPDKLGSWCAQACLSCPHTPYGRRRARRAMKTLANSTRGMIRLTDAYKDASEMMRALEAARKELEDITNGIDPNSMIDNYKES
jgi:hypothetical protein